MIINTVSKTVRIIHSIILLTAPVSNVVAAEPLPLFEISVRYIKMSALERFGVTFTADQVYLRGNVVTGNDLKVLMDDPSFVEFIAPAEKKLLKLGFMFSYANGNYQGVFLNYYNQFDHKFIAKIRCMSDGTNHAFVAPYRNAFHLGSLSQLKKENPSAYFRFKSEMRTRTNLMTLEAENNALRQKNNALEAEILELKFRPGGDEYERAREHFETLRDAL